jgi:hypothetical protein
MDGASRIIVYTYLVCFQFIEYFTTIQCYYRLGMSCHISFEHDFDNIIKELYYKCNA